MNEAIGLRRVLLLTCGAFVAVTAALIAASLLIVSGLETEPTETATIGYIVAGVTSLAGLAVAISFRSTVTEQTVELGALRTRFFVTAAIAEIGMLLGFVWSFVSHEYGPLFLGAGLFLVSLAVIASGVTAADVTESI